LAQELLESSGDTAEGIPWIEHGIRDLRTTGAVLALPYYLALKAEALHLADRTFEALQAIREAEVVVQKIEERQHLAELHRLRGVFLANIGADDTQIETSFCEAIRAAKEQKSASFRLLSDKVDSFFALLVPEPTGTRSLRTILPLDEDFSPFKFEPSAKQEASRLAPGSPPEASTSPEVSIRRHSRFHD